MENIKQKYTKLLREECANQVMATGSLPNFDLAFEKVLDLAIAERDRQVVEMIEEQKQKYVENNEKEFGGWQDEIDTCNKIIKLIK